MKIIALGDTHGRVIWKEIIKKEKDADFIVFIGDYFDTHGGVSANKQLVNFKEILEFKRKNFAKVILLIGNHDFHYIKGIDENYSNYQFNYAKEFSEAIQHALDENLLQMCWTHGKYLFSHAGVTKTWATANRIIYDNLDKPTKIDLDILIQNINQLFKDDTHKFKFTIGANFSNYGDDICQSPIWVRPASLYADKLDDVIYVVGHTTANYLDVSKADSHNLILIDTLGTSKEYLVIEDGIAKVENV